MKFDTLNKKPTVFNILFLTLVTAVLVGILWFLKVDDIILYSFISIAYLATVPPGKLHYLAGVGADDAALFEICGVTGQSVNDNPESEDPADRGNYILKGPNGELVSSEDLAFDHGRIIRTAILRMRGKLDYTDLAFGFVEDPSSFTLTELRIIHEAILDHPLDIGNFRRTIKREYEAAGRIEERGLEKGSVGRPAMLYRFT